MKFDRKRKLKIYEENKEDIFFVGETQYMELIYLEERQHTKKESLILGKI